MEAVMALLSAMWILAMITLTGLLFLFFKETFFK